MQYDRLAAQLQDDEGRETRVYTDSVGKLTCGVGRNISDRPFSQDEIDLMLKNDIALAVSELDRVIPWWRKLDDIRQEVMVNMMFNLGAPRLLGFKKFLTYAEAGRWEISAAEMLDSTWAKQVKGRAIRLANQFRTGVT